MKKHTASDSRSADLNEQMLAAVSRLKRVIGAADNPNHQDHFENRVMRIYVTDVDSAKILRSLFHQFVHGDKPVSEWKPDGTGNPLPVNEVVQWENNPLYVETFVPPALRQQFIERLDRYLKILTAATARKGPAR